MAVAALLTGCGQAPGTSGPTPTDESPTAELTVVVRPNTPDAQPEQWSLTCQPPGGTHPAPEKACQALSSAKRPFQPPPRETQCTMIYGGPQTATLEGTWHGEPVKATYGRGNGCELAQWEALEPLLDPHETMEPLPTSTG